MATKQQQKMKEKAKTRRSVFSKIKLVFTRGRRKKQSDDVPKRKKVTPVYHDMSEMPPEVVTREIGQIRALLHQSQYVMTYLDALSKQGSTQPIEDILLNDQAFSKYACYQNKKIARYYAANLAGLGLFQLLLDDRDKLEDERITDIGYNSNHFLTVETNMRKFTYGNRKGEPPVNNDIIMDIINKMTEQSGVEGRAFTKTYPLYNGSNKINRLRISATHPSVSPYGPTLSIRVSSPYLALNEKNFDRFAPMNKKLNVLRLLRIFIKCHMNIMISAKTGAGKTELQKFLIKFIPDMERIVLMEDTAEMYLPELYPTKDIFSWISGNRKGADTITDLVVHSLRNEPTWLIVAETRGAEAYEMFQAVKTDHSIITTLHASTNEAVPSRFAGMIQEGYDNMKTELLERDFLNFMNIGIHLTIKYINGRAIRYLDEIAEFLPVSKQYPKGVNVLFKQNINSAGVRTYHTGKPSKMLQELIFIASDHVLNEKLWPQYSAQHPMKDLVYPDLYDAYKKEQKLKEHRHHG